MPEPNHSVQRRQRKSAQERREDILIAASKVFAEHGFRCADVQQIADLAGVGKGTIYRFYATKDELFRAAVDDAMQRLTHDIDVLVDAQRNPLDQLKAAFGAYLRFFQANPEVIELFVHERAELRGAKPLYFVYSDARRQRWLDVCQQLIDSGTCRLSDPALILDALGNMAYGCVFTNRISGRNEPLENDIDRLTDLLFHGVLQK